MTVIEGITLAIAAVGAVLGILNTWNQLDRRRVKLVVFPKGAIPMGPGIDPNINMCVEVTNLSEFPVSVHEVGFELDGTTERAVVTDPIFLDGGSMPRRLESRSSFTAYCIATPSPILGKAYARTDCGEIATGSSDALRAFRQSR